jgi:purine-cytosine permease-like protein
VSQGTATATGTGRHIEQHGVEYIPEQERHSRPLNLFTTLTGANLTFGVIVIGWLPVAFGLDWWGTFSSIVVGTAVGALILAPIALLGPRTGTNGPVSSGAFFGVVGRLIGTLLALFIAVGFYALAVWTGGQVVVYGLHALWGMPDGKLALGISYTAMAVICTWVAVWGHDLLIRVNRWLIPTAGLLILIGFFVYAGRFHPHALTSSYALGSFWPTWTLAVTISASTTFGYAPYVNDWTRLISRNRYNDISVAGAVAGGSFLGLLFPLAFGAFSAYAVNSLNLDYVSGLMTVTPKAFMVPVILIGFVGSLGQGALCLYGNGLDLSSIVRSVSRATATALVSAISLVFIFLGTLVWSIENTVSAFLTILGVVAAAWIGIVLAGHFSRRTDYDTRALQVFNERRRGGAYWYWHGWNLRAAAVWVLASVVGILFSSTSIYSGPWSALAGGVDLSWLSAGIVAALAYLGLSAIIPGKSAAQSAASSLQAAGAEGARIAPGPGTDSAVG